MVVRLEIKVTDVIFLSVCALYFKLELQLVYQNLTLQFGQCSILSFTNRGGSPNQHTLPKRRQAYSKHKRKRTGPVHSSSVLRTCPFCTTSILPSRAKIRATSRVGDMRLLHATEKGISPRLANPRGISLGQHVFGFLFSSTFSISCFSVSSSTVSKYVDVLFVVADSCTATAAFSVFHLFALLAASTVGGANPAFDTAAVSTKKSSRILLRFPPSSKSIPSSSNIHLFFRTLGRSSPHSWPNPPRDRSEATTRCHGTS